MKVFAFIILSVMLFAGLTREELDSFVSKVESEYGTKFNELKSAKYLQRWHYKWSNRIDQNNELDIIQLYKDFAQDLNKSTNNLQSDQVTWEAIGPFGYPQNGKGVGRINAVRFNPSNQSELYVATASGGVWKSINEGESWTVIPHTQFLSMAYSDIAIAPSNTNVIYLASGDANATYASAGDFYSLGILKSTNGGQSFNMTNLAYELDDRKTIGRVLVDPNDENYVLASSVDGIFLSEDGGNSWEHRLENITIKDMEFHTSDPNLVLATSFDRDGGTQILRSTNKGKTWATSSGFAEAGRVDIAVEPNFPGYVVAVAAEVFPYSFYRFQVSEDFGQTWNIVSEQGDGTAKNILGRTANGGFFEPGSDDSDQGLYDLTVAINPSNKNHIFVGGINNWESDDGGKTWFYNSLLRAEGQFMHVDQHDLQIRADGTRFYTNDGGIYKFKNDQLTRITNDMNIGQIYRTSFSSGFKWNINGLQDNSTQHYIDGEGWYQTNNLGGDGMDNAINPLDSQYWYGSSQYGNFKVSSNGGQSFHGMFTRFNTRTSNNEIEEGDWITPIKLDPRDPKNVYLGYYNVYLSEENGLGSKTFRRISDFNNTNPLTIIEISELNSNFIYVSNGFSIWKTTNKGQAWENIPIPSQNVSSIDIHPNDPNRIVATISTYSPRRKVYTLKGDEWTNISGNLPNVPVNVARFQKDSPDRIYIGTELGVYYSDYNSAFWLRYGKDMPFTIILDLEINEDLGKLAAASYGTGLYITDLIDCERSLIELNEIESSEVCSGQSIEVSIKDPIPGVEYFWTTGQTGTSINVDKGGQVSVRTGGDCPMKSEFIDFIERPSSPVIINANSRQMCPGDTLLLRAPLGASDPVWDDGSTERQREVYGPGIYTLSITSNFGCTEIGEIEITLPQSPQIIKNEDGDLEVPEGFDSYQWFRNGEPIEGAGSRIYSGSVEALYTVEVQIQNDCIVTSPEFDYVLTVTENKDFNITPNPNTGRFSIDLSSVNDNLRTINIYNSIGQSVYAESIFGNPKSKDLNINNLQPGVYFVTIQTNSKFYVDKMVIE